MMVDLQQVIEALVDRQTENRAAIDRLTHDLKRAFDEIAQLRRASTVSPQNVGGADNG